MCPKDLALTEKPYGFFREGRCLLVFPEAREVIGVPAPVGECLEGQSHVPFLRIEPSLPSGPDGRHAFARLRGALAARRLLAVSRTW